MFCKPDRIPATIAVARGRCGSCFREPRVPTCRLFFAFVFESAISRLGAAARPQRTRPPAFESVEDAMLPRCSFLLAAILPWLLAPGSCAAAQFGSSGGPRRVLLVSERLGLNRGTPPAARSRWVRKRRAIESRRADKPRGPFESSSESTPDSPFGQSLVDWEFRRQTRSEVLRQLNRRSSNEAQQLETQKPISTSSAAPAPTSNPLDNRPRIEPLAASSDLWLLPSRRLLLPADLEPGT